MDNAMKNKTWDVTNGLVRFYEPSNLGIEVANNMWGADGIGILGARSIGQPNITFKLETFGTNLKQNYDLITEFVQDLLSVKYVTLEYQTESFQVFADVALSNVTKTEGYGHCGQFSETIEFEIVTKWYTFENLSLKTLQNGEIIEGKSKIYGGQYSQPNTNLQPETSLLSGMGTWSSYPTAGLWEVLPPQDGISAGIMHSKPATQNNQQSYIIPHNIPVTAGETYTVSFDYKDLNWSSQITIAQIRIIATNNGLAALESFSIRPTEGTPDWQRKSFTFTANESGFLAFFYYCSDTTGNYEGFYRRLKVEKGNKSTQWLPSEIGLAGYRYIANEAYTYYGETDIGRLSRWDIDKPFFSFIARLKPAKGVAPNQEYGLQFLNTNGNQYSAILFTLETAPDEILINTDVNDEYYLSSTDGTTINAFPTLDFQSYRTRIFQEGQMVMKNISEVEIKVKRKVDFI